MPAVLPEQLRLWRWIADYYLCSLGEVFKAALPSGLKLEGKDAAPRTHKRKLVQSSAISPDEIPSPQNGNWKGAVLNDLQQEAMDNIINQWQTHSVCLLHGVTSSGKTEIYIHLIQKAIEEGKQVLFMLPEIVLTTQLTERLRRVFGDHMGVYHSRYTDKARVELYNKMLSDTPYDIVVGVRSSIFLPFKRLGLLIIDEEHESSFKQQDPAPRYHARNVALVLAARVGAKTLLGSATPSLESYHNALSGKYGFVTLKTRYAGLCLPTIEVVDVQEMHLSLIHI